MPYKAFIEQCKKRKILKGFSIYAIVSWVIIQVAATTFPFLHIPSEAVTYIIMMVLIGLPISIIFSWYYNVIPDDQKISNKTAQIASNKKVSNLFLVLIIILSVIILTIISFLLNKNFDNIETSESVNGNGRIAVLEFSNFITEPGFEKLGKATASWISHGLIENNIARVITPQIINDYSSAMEAALISTKKNVVNDVLAAEKIIEGSISKDGNNLIFKCMLKDGITGEFIIGFEDVVVDSSEPIKGIESLKSKVLGYFATQDNPLLKLQEDPPNYEAYLFILEVKELDITDPKALDLMNKALEIDPDYFEAKVWRLAHYYNIRNYSIADSIRKTIQPNSNSNFRQINLLNFYSALLAGKNRQIYETWANEYKFCPFDLVTNQAMMTLAMQFIFQPSELQSIFNEIKVEEMNLETCISCKYRVHLKAISDIELKKYESAINLLEPYIKINVDHYILEPLIAAYIRTGEKKKLNALFNKLPNLIIEQDWSNMYLVAAREYLLLQDSTTAKMYLDQGIYEYQAKEKNLELAKAYFFKKEYEKAIPILKELDENNQLGSLGKAQLASAYYKLDQFQNSTIVQKEIEDINNLYNFGSKQYALAFIEAQKGNNDTALNLLLEAVKKGYTYGFEEFHNELAFISLSQEDRFQEILGFWH